MKASVPVDSLHRGINHRRTLLPGRVAVNTGPHVAEWAHPWTLEVAWISRAAAAEELKAGSPKTVNNWWAWVTVPGFVNGHEVFIPMRAQDVEQQQQQNPQGINPLSGEQFFSASVFKKKPPAPARKKTPTIDVPLTADIAPYLVLADWRNPLVGDLGTGDINDPELTVGPGEGYPSFFNSQGVKFPALGGPLNEAGAAARATRARNRELRAMDVVLIQPRVGTALDVTVNPSGLVTGQALVSYSTRTITDYVVAQQGRARLEAQTRFVPPGNRNIDGVFNLPLDGGDPQFDGLKIATVWMVSPPNASPTDQPDETWEPWVQYFVFWNLAYAPGNISELAAHSDSLTFGVPLAGGLANPLINSFLSIFNTGFEEAVAFLTASQSEGQFWTT